MRYTIRKISAIVLSTVLALGLITCKKETINPPTVKVLEGVITLNYTSAKVSANVTDHGGAEVKSRGFAYGLQGGTMDTVYCGSGTGVYSADLNNLHPNTAYVYEAFAKNAGGMGTSGKFSFTTRDNEAPKVKTSEVSEVGTTTATGGGEVTADGGVTVTERGLCWSTSHNPTITQDHVSAGGGMGNFTCNLTNLTANTLYYVRAYAKNSKGTAYGGEKMFTTSVGELPEVITANVINPTQTTAIGGGEVTNDGGTPVTERGICWSSGHNPTTDNHKVSAGEGLGSFTCDITGLYAHATYYVRAYATNAKGTNYGREVSFNTSAYPPTVSTGNVIHITTTSATGSGNVTSDGGSPVTERGLCWNTDHNPTVGGPHIAAGSGMGWFSATITGLSLNTVYYVRAYATNEVTTTYGDEVEFKTLSISPPGVTTAMVTGIDRTTAIGGGNVVSDGGAIVTERGICWSTRPNPDISGNHQSSGTGMGSYTVNMTGLTPNTTYYVKAYAINNQGIAYGEQVDFETESIDKPKVTTDYMSSITQTSAICGGNVTDAGGGIITARGVCWSTNPNPTISNQHTTDGGGMGNFTSQITGLTSGTMYYVKAYATNSAGTEYGVQRTFTTEPPIPQGAISGKFTINSSGSRVYFSKGNLQYIGSSQTWKFAEQQWEVKGTSQGNSSQSTTRDLFGWGTSGWYCGNTYYRPWDTNSSNGSLYGPPGANNLADSYANADWGYRNAISNGGNQTHQWRTLRYAEWDYVLNQRNTSSGKRYAKAKVNNVNGVILLPDDWSTNYYTLNNCNQYSASFNSNVINSSTWLNSLQAHGAIFLPAAGYRNGTSVYSVDSLGYYWSSSYYDYNKACTVYFSGSNFSLGNNIRYNGYSVRLVCPVQ